MPAVRRAREARAEQAAQVRGFYGRPAGKPRVDMVRMAGNPTGEAGGCDDRWTELDRLIDCHYVQIHSYVRAKISCEADAEDITQEVFIRYCRNYRRVDPAEAKALLFVIAKNVMTDHFRRNKVQRMDWHVDVAGVSLASDTPDHMQVIDASADAEVLQAAISALPPRCRNTFVLSRFEGLTYEQIALRLGISMSMVEKHIMKALQRCRAALEKARQR